MFVLSIFGVIVKNTRCHSAFHKVILAALAGVMVWGAMSYTSRSPLVLTDDTLNSSCFLSIFLRLVSLPFVSAVLNSTFQANAQSYIADFVLTFFD